MNKLINWNEIEINHCEFTHIDFFINEEKVECQINGNKLYFSYNGEVLGKNLKLIIDGVEEIVSIEEMPKLADFDEHYAYLEDDLGPTYSKDCTTFKLWAPLATRVTLRILNKEFNLIRGDKGVFEIKINSDLDGALYDYVITLDGKEVVTIDPYAKSSNANGEKSAVINLNKISQTKYNDKSFKNYTDAIIYEGHVRDLTINPSTNIVHKGKYLGLTEENKKSPKGNPVGIDYLKSLGITHLQLLPVLDYGSVDENSSDYNWGYDPMQFFTLEGSYSTNPNDPYSRIIEFKQLVDKLHSASIKVILDVVYNHIYKINNFSLNKITPNYFFRIEGDKLADHSWCGNDFQTERAMARKIIVDSVMYLLQTFDVDGFRFDLMGLIDVDTMNEITTKVKKYKSFAMIYGEGWDMFAVSNYGAKFANYKNADLLPNVAFFNDSYRNTARGTGSKATLDEKGYLLGNKSYLDGFKYAFSGSVNDYPFPHLFTSLNQSINYVECHDNATLFDVVNSCNNEENPLKTVEFINKVLLLSPGIAFIHMGQEFGQSKNNNCNSYNSGDAFNQFNVDLMDERISMVDSLKEIIKFRKANIICNESVSFEQDNENLYIKLNNCKLTIDSINKKCLIFNK